MSRTATQAARAAGAGVTCTRLAATSRTAACIVSVDLSSVRSERLSAERNGAR